MEIRGGRRGTTTLPLLATDSAIHGHPIPRKVALVAAEHELHTGNSGQPWMKLSSAASTERLEFSTSNGGGPLLAVLADISKQILLVSTPCCPHQIAAQPGWQHFNLPLLLLFVTTTTTACTPLRPGSHATTQLGRCCYQAIMTATIETARLCLPTFYLFDLFSFPSQSSLPSCVITFELRFTHYHPAGPV